MIVLGIHKKAPQLTYLRHAVHVSQGALMLHAHQKHFSRQRMPTSMRLVE